MQKVPIESLVGNAEEFPILAQWDFFNHAGVAPIPRRSAMAVVKYAGQAAEQSYLDSRWYERIEIIRRVAATLINASADEIALIKNTSEGLALVAAGIDWQAGDRIVTTAVEYPANAYPWIDLQQRKGIDLVRVEEIESPDGVRQVPLEQILAAADHPRTRMVTLSHVEFGTGQRHDLHTIGRFCRARGILLCVDAIQSIGALPVDVKAMQIDFLSADGHKWMMGPEGAGIFYCRREIIEQVRPVLVGWMNVKRPLDFDRIDWDLKTDAGRFECGSWNVPGFLGLGTSLELILDVGIDAIWMRLKSLTDRLAAGLPKVGFTVVSPRTEAQASGIISFTRAGLDPAAVAKRLQQAHRIELATRFGRLRCSPHYYNTEAQIDRLLEKLAEASS